MIVGQWVRCLKGDGWVTESGRLCDRCVDKVMGGGLDGDRSQGEMGWHVTG